MATIPPINYGALKVTFPANLPRNEKDLICMLLAGRLKDLWNGKLICAQLAINDLLKDTMGIDALGSLRNTLVGLNKAIKSFKALSGYDSMLSGINGALGQVNNVFSLGGLCPSPVQAPKIPDLLGALNQNLFGQANNILNALVQASNPKVCLGGGPKGFGLDWRQVNGSLKNLKNAINQFKADPAGYQRTIDAFERNLKSQTKRLKSEIKRLKANLSDPLGINARKQSINNTIRTKNVSDGYAVKDRNGVEYQGPAKLMTTGEIDSVLARTDPVYTNPIKYQMYPVLDYCGNITGYEKRIVSGDANYMGWDNVYEETNINNPTTLPTSEFAQFAYTFVEENSTVNVYNSAGTKVTGIALSRGKHYRLGFKLSTKTIRFYNGSSVWTNGLLITQQPSTGTGFETVDPTLYSTSDYSLTNATVEVDWSVLIENPTTPNSLTWKTTDNLITGNIVVSGETSLADVDKTYDVDMAAKKAWLFLIKDEVTDSDTTVNVEEVITTRQYTMASVLTGVNAGSYTATLTYNSGYTVIDETESVEDVDGNKTYPYLETVDENGSMVEGSKIVKFWQTVGSKYLVIKKYINDEDGFQLNQINCFLTSSLTDESSNHELLANVTFDEPFVFLNDIKLTPEHKGNLTYKIAIYGDGKATGMDESSITVIDNEIIINLTSNRTNADVGQNEFIYRSIIEIDPSDIGRTYQNTDPVETETYLYFKGTGFSLQTTITKNG